MEEDSSWHRWLLTKEIQERQLKQLEYMDLLKNRSLANQRKRDKKDQLKQANKAFEKWVEEKNIQAKKQEIIRQKKNEKLKAEKEKETEIKRLKSQSKYKEWTLKKNEEEIEKKKIADANHAKQAEIIREKAQLNKEAFSRWNESSKTRKKDPLVGYVYSSGTLLGKCK